MALFTQGTPPSLPLAGAEYTQRYMNQLTNVLRLYFNSLNAPQQLNPSKLNLDLNTLPTDADVASLVSGDVYRDTTAGNVLKVKV